jgi:hypothetical protein
MAPVMALRLDRVHDGRGMRGLQCTLSSWLSYGMWRRVVGYVIKLQNGLSWTVRRYSKYGLRSEYDRRWLHVYRHLLVKYVLTKSQCVRRNNSGFGGLGVSVLASGTQVRGFKPGRSRRIFNGGKILSTPSFGREVKPWVRRFAACKRNLNVPWKSAFRKNSRFQLPPECGTRR